MCGYIGNVHQAPGVIDLMNELGITLPLPYFQSYQLRIHPALITAGEGGYHLSNAMWWYAMKKVGGNWVPDTDITSFNARNLASRMWKPAIESRRGLIFGTEVGESKGKDRYLMRSQMGLAVGTVYQDWHAPGVEPIRSMAVITRPPHPRFSQYHDKSIPHFLPMDAEAIKTWLDPRVGSDHPEIRELLETPKIHTPLSVTKVKSFVRAEPLGEPEELAADE
ncbi:SOS response-associated peptidase family protein [Marinimicrobium sp. ABcell2]|uniref:SOS response-associated peptidase family protein n=1 Tax=Marinimicrobium sp. ABcell2 TaxID=3069751 RepID=UPI0027B813D3|nr:SOS response-associated peptidase family protein [Marinimicrobium sp. ABcell2]MDQ2077782.1 SOS response-associated peptidase family protein [Marinimicrobium sp. ABcell2]